MKRDYEKYCWSIATLDRRLCFFDCTMFVLWRINQKLVMQHEVQVQRNLVHKMLQNEYPEGLQFLPPIKIRRKKGFSLAIVRLMLYRVTVTRNCVGITIGLCVYPLGVYGCLDTYRRKILFLYICYSNSNPMFIGRKYLKFLAGVKTLSRFIRIDCGLRLEIWPQYKHI